MFGWLKRKGAATAVGDTVPLYFKDSHAAFSYACQHLHCDLTAGAVLPALVLDAAAATGSGAAVKRQTDGNQITMLRVCSKDGGFVVFAASASANGPDLQPGDLVAWQAGQPVEAMASQLPDPRSTWAGLILARLLPEFTVGRGWAIQQPFRP
jgi:hypothetical protein